MDMWIKAPANYVLCEKNKYRKSNAANISANTWTIEAVDAPKYFTYFSTRAIAVDASDHPHIAYGGDHLYYDYYDGSKWNYQTADSSPGVGYFASIALDTSGKVHISYFDYSNGDLKYATNAHVNKPTVKTRFATQVTDYDATLNGTVNGHGLTTRVWF